MNNPKVSIITVVYNGEQYLEDTIKSVINQTYGNIEYIIIDGGSTDGTVDIIKKYEDKISYWASEQDEGIYDAMNKGIDRVNGDWINFMNAGDSFYAKNTIEKVFARNSESYKNIDIIYGDLEIDYGDFKRIERVKPLQEIWKGMVFSHQSCFINSDFHKSNKYALEYKITSDFNLFYNAYKKNNRFFYICQVVSTVIINGLSDSNHSKVCRENVKIVTNNDIRIKYITYYIYLYIITLFKDFVKLVLGNKFSELVKKLK